MATHDANKIRQEAINRSLKKTSVTEEDTAPQKTVKPFRFLRKRSIGALFSGPYIYLLFSLILVFANAVGRFFFAQSIVLAPINIVFIGIVIYTFGFFNPTIIWSITPQKAAELKNRDLFKAKINEYWSVIQYILTQLDGKAFVENNSIQKGEKTEFHSFMLWFGAIGAIITSFIGLFTFNYMTWFFVLYFLYQMVVSIQQNTMLNYANSLKWVNLALFITVLINSILSLLTYNAMDLGLVFVLAITSTIYDLTRRVDIYGKSK